MPITEDNKIIYEYQCLECGAEFECDEKLPLGRECKECGGFPQHVGPVLDECDKCSQELLYRGNSGLGDDTLCDGCYDRMKAVM